MRSLLVCSFLFIFSHTQAHDQNVNVRTKDSSWFETSKMEYLWFRVIAEKSLVSSVEALNEGKTEKYKSCMHKIDVSVGTMALIRAEYARESEKIGMLEWLLNYPGLPRSLPENPDIYVYYKGSR